jgi:hypothetical protein
LLFIPFLLVGALGSIAVGLLLQGSIMRALRYTGQGSNALQIVLRVFALGVAPAALVGALAFSAFATFFDPRSQQGISPLLLVVLLAAGMSIVFAVARWLGRVLGSVLPHGRFLVQISAVADMIAQFGALAVYALYPSWVALVVTTSLADQRTAEKLLAAIGPVAWTVTGAAFVSGWSDATMKQFIRETMIVEEVRRQERERLIQNSANLPPSP